MIIECVKCSKKFEVNSDLIPEAGRSIQCGSCNHIWFFQKKELIPDQIISSKPYPNKVVKEKIKEKNIGNLDDKKNIKKSKTDLVKYQKKTNFTFGTFLSYIFVTIISFISLMIIIDTFKFQLFDIFPELELILFNFYETLKDINLFIKDLI